MYVDTKHLLENYLLKCELNSLYLLIHSPETNLANIHLYGAYLVSAKLSTANLSGANLSQAILS